MNQQVKTLNRYVPSLVLQTINKLEYPNKEHLYIICDMLNRITMFRNISYDNDYIDIPMSYFKDILVNYEYRKTAIDFLISNQILECDNKYSKIGGKAKGYRFNVNLISKLEKVVVSKPTLVKKVIGNKNKRNNSVSDILKPNRDYFLRSFHIEYDKALFYIENLYEKELGINPTVKQFIKATNRYNSYLMSISSIQDRELYFFNNKTNNRVDTNLTSLKRELKKFIYSKDNNLYLCSTFLSQIDISNSQPLFLFYLISKDNNLYLCSTFSGNQEFDKYKLWCISGKFYENFQQEYYHTTGILLPRDRVKTMIFTIFFANNKDKWTNEYCSQFKSVFPHIFQFIFDYKSKEHKKLANDLTKLESSVCIFKVVPQLNLLKINNYTIHDSWTVRNEDVDKTKEVIEDIFYNQFGVIPNLKIKVLADE